KTAAEAAPGWPESPMTARARSRVWAGPRRSRSAADCTRVPDGRRTADSGILLDVDLKAPPL
ncbi:MAG: hypothetical protein KAJ42_07825, partial [Gemmatimonadetes bacterium]|nr:hypothetical protein [Gemmatimonadota bacterium]